jgi:hypothetical protein
VNNLLPYSRSERYGYTSLLGMVVLLVVVMVVVVVVVMGW